MVVPTAPWEQYLQWFVPPSASERCTPARPVCAGGYDLAPQDGGINGPQGLLCCCWKEFVGRLLKNEEVVPILHRDDTVEARRGRGDPAPACAKRSYFAEATKDEWRGACAVLWGRPADSLSAGNAGDTSKLRSRQRHHLGRWRGTPILHRGSVSNAGYNRSEALRWR